MRTLRAEDFDTLAKSVVDDYLERKVPMTRSVIKTAQEMELNPDQVKNLVQIANVLAHMTLFDRKNDGDKNIEFEPADPFAVFKSIYKDEGDGTCCPSCGGDTASADSAAADKTVDLFGDLPDLDQKIKAVVEGTPSGGESQKTETSPDKKHMLIIRVQKVAEDLNQRKLAAAIEFHEELDKLASIFSHLYSPSFEEFEKDAMVARGAKAAGVLGMLRERMRLPQPEQLKYASLARATRVVDTTTREMKSLDRLVKLADDFEECQAACDYLKEKAGRWL